LIAAASSVVMATSIDFRFTAVEIRKSASSAFAPSCQTPTISCGNLQSVGCVALHRPHARGHVSAGAAVEISLPVSVSLSVLHLGDDLSPTVAQVSLSSTHSDDTGTTAERTTSNRK